MTFSPPAKNRPPVRVCGEASKTPEVFKVPVVDVDSAFEGSHEIAFETCPGLLALVEDRSPAAGTRCVRAPRSFRARIAVIAAASREVSGG
jgi:hypothetical protein